MHECIFSDLSHRLHIYSHHSTQVEDVKRAYQLRIVRDAQAKAAAILKAKEEWEKATQKLEQAQKEAQQKLADSQEQAKKAGAQDKIDLQKKQEMNDKVQAARELAAKNNQESAMKTAESMTKAAQEHNSKTEEHNQKEGDNKKVQEGKQKTVEEQRTKTQELATKAEQVQNNKEQADKEAAEQNTKAIASEDAEKARDKRAKMPTTADVRLIVCVVCIRSLFVFMFLFAHLPILQLVLLNQVAPMTGYQNPKMVVNRQLCFLTGDIQSAMPIAGDIAQLPENCRPSHRVFFG